MADAAGASSSLPHRLLLNCHYLLTCSPGCVRALPEVARGMISINSPPWGENELSLIYFSPRSLKPTKVTGTFIFRSFPISLTLRLYWTKSFCLSWSGVVELYNSSIFCFIRNLYTVFHSGCTDLHSHNGREGSPFSVFSPAFIVRSLT